MKDKKNSQILYKIDENIRYIMDGDITFESELGKGTTFYVTIPLPPKLVACSE